MSARRCRGAGFETSAINEAKVLSSTFANSEPVAYPSSSNSSHRV